MAGALNLGFAEASISVTFLSEMGKIVVIKARIERVATKWWRRIKRFLPENRLGDRIYAYVLFVLDHGLRPKSQMLFNDVLYKIKTSDEILDPLRLLVSDKELLKLFVTAVVGDQFNVPTIDVIRDVSVVDDYEFPPRCCIKSTHGNMQIIFRLDGEPVDRELIKSWFSYNQYRNGNRGANYKTLRPKVIVEPLVFDRSSIEDYKVFCLNGVPKMIQVDFDRSSGHKRRLFDCDWNPLDYSLSIPNFPGDIPKPANLDLMLDLAKKLSARFGFVRIDLYSDGISCKVGEITNCHGGARRKFIPRDGEIGASMLIFTGSFGQIGSGNK
jgi:hypothetical protein